MSSGIVRAVYVAPFVVCACSVGALDAVGMQCIGTCPDGLVCTAGVCEVPGAAGAEASTGDGPRIDAGGTDGTIGDGMSDAATDADADASVTTPDVQTTVAYVQSCNAVYVDAPDAAGFECPLSAVASGDLLVAVVQSQPGSTVTVTDSQGNAYPQAIAEPSANTLNELGIYYASGVNGGTGEDGGPFVVTAIVSPPGPGVIIVQEYAGVIGSEPLDKRLANTGYDNAEMVSSGSVQVSANELVFGVGRSDDGVVETTSSGAWNGRVYTNGAYTEDSLGPLPGQYAATFTPLGDSGTWTALIASFRGN